MLLRWLLALSFWLSLSLALDFRTRNVRPENYRSLPGVADYGVQPAYSNPYQQFASQMQMQMHSLPAFLPVYQPEPLAIPPSESYRSLPPSMGMTLPPVFTPPALMTTTSTRRSPETKATTLGVVKITRQMSPRKGSSRLSKMAPKGARNSTETRRGSAHVSVPSHRLLNDILVIPSERRLYILAIMPIHESAKSQGFECGNLDVNAFLRLSAFLRALDDVNASPQLREANLHLGAVIVDSCSSDLRAVADLYELLSGTNIEKSDIIAIVRDDKAFLPNVDDFVRHLRIPTLNTFFSPRQQLLTTGTLPSEEAPLEAILELMLHTRSTCVSVVFDEFHSESIKALNRLAEERGICLDQQIQVQGLSTVETQQNAIRRLVLSEARTVIVLYGDKSWIDLLHALSLEMVIPGRFAFIALQNDLWTTSRQFLELWPHFDQLLLSVAPAKSANLSYVSELTRMFPSFPFPKHWLRQFWATAFHCHIDGVALPGEQFSRPCPQQQNLNFSFVAPDFDVAPVTLAVHAVGHSLRSLVDNVCPGALVHSLTDCLNEPYRSLFASLMSVHFYHPLLDIPFSVNASTGFADAALRLNRVSVERGVLRADEIARWDPETGLLYTAEQELVVEERDGSRVRLQSTCPKSACFSESAIRAKIGVQPSFKEGLHDMASLVFSAFATLLTFVYLMCMYQQLVGAKHDPYRICTMVMFSGLVCLSMVSIFFIMHPSWITCAIRRNCLSVAASLVFAPILVKTIAIWNREVLRRSSTPVSGVALFWVSLGLVAVQLVVVVEWSVFEDPTLLEFVSFGEAYAWRCVPGARFEQRLFLSMLLDVLFIVVSLVCSVLSVKNPHSRQNILVCTAAVTVGIALSVCLPLIPFRRRDQVFAGVLLAYTVLVLVITYCQKGFVSASSSVSSGKEELVVEHSPDPDKMSQSGADRSHVWQNPYPSSTLPGVHRQSSLLDYSISSRRVPSVNYMTSAGIYGRQSEYRTPSTR
uniref:G_PROTEIN_RECEP_F3_4 domain-containing protein n=1 Tax=Steinernema glaseri TaxID=37863 RepID=A0A1I7ZT88_9BILA